MLAGYATHTDAARGLPRRPEWNLAMTPRRCCNKKDTARCCRHLDDDDLCRRPRRARTGSVARHGARPRGRLRRRGLRGRRGRRRERAHRAQRAGPDRHRLRDAVLHVQGLAPPLAGPGKHVLLRQAAVRRRAVELRRAPGVFAASRRGRRIRGGGGENVAGPPGRRGPASRPPRRIRARLASSRALQPSVSRRRRLSGTRRRRRSRPWTSRRPCPSSGPSTSSAPSPCRSWPSASSSATPRARAPRSSTGDRRRGARFCSLNTSSFTMYYGTTARPVEGHVTRRS